MTKSRKIDAVEMFLIEYAGKTFSDRVDPHEYLKRGIRRLVAKENKKCHDWACKRFIQRLRDKEAWDSISSWNEWKAYQKENR